MLPARFKTDEPIGEQLMEASVNETRLILLASVNVIPNVVSALHYWKAGGLAAIHILYTDDDRNSRSPALRMKKLLDELCAVAPFDNRSPAVIALDSHPVGIEPQAVRERVTQLTRQAPSARWVVNVTGGLKLMAFGGVGIPEPPPRLIYMERGQGWFALASAAGSVTATRDPELPVDGGALLDEIPIASIVRTQFANAERFSFTNKGKPAAMDVAAFVRQGIESRWSWRTLADPGERFGFAFERLIGAAVLRMSIDNVAWSFKIGEVHEMDLVLCRRGIVWLLDLKLMPPEGEKRPHAQIREASESGNAIGGVDRRVIMLRPNWEAVDETMALAKAHNVLLITQEQSGNLFSLLADMMGGTLDDNLQEADRLLSDGKNQLGFALAAPSLAHKVMPPRSDSGIVSMEDVFQNYCRREDQNWMLVDHGAHVEFWIRSAGPGVDWKALVNRSRLFSGIECSLTHRTGFLTWGEEQLQRGVRQSISGALRAARGKVIDFQTFRTWCGTAIGE